MSALFFGLLVTHALLSCAHAHGRLFDPPGRSTAWRFGFDIPTNYNDNQLYCGGFSNQWFTNGGKCGECGDSWQQSLPRDHEAGGKYGTGTVVKEYLQGQIITVTVEITANHLGYFEFRLCPVNHPKIPATAECLDRHLVRTLDGSTRHYIDSNVGKKKVVLQLPTDLTCTQCVMQWKYHTANRWGIDRSTGKGCLGCGERQEEFYGCADIAIRPFDGTFVTKAPTTTTTKPTTTTTRKPSTKPTTTTTTTTTPKPAPTTTPTTTTTRATTTTTTISPTTAFKMPSICGFLCKYLQGVQCPAICKEENPWQWRHK